MTEEILLDKAKQAMANAYAPYSKFKVGAALLTSNGEVYTGCNIENASFGATVCAERVAIFKAISEGAKDFEAIAIVCGENRVASPCGMCRQVMSEFFNKDTKIILEDEGGVYTYTFEELMPLTFDLNV